MHLDEEQVQRLLDGELTGQGETSARRHLEVCGDCRARLDGAEKEEGEVATLLRQLDGPLPLVDADAIAVRARGHELWWLRRAAGFVLVLGIAGAVYAMPGSPLRPWVRAVATWVGVRPDPAPPAPSLAPAPEPQLAGIAVAPGKNLLIQFTSPQTAGGCRVSLTDGAEVVVRAPLGAATFTSGVDRLVIDNQGSAAVFEIEIPSAAPRIEIRVRDNRIFLKEGSRVSTEETSGFTGPFLLPLGPSGS